MVYMPVIPTPEAVETDFDWADSFKRERMRRWLSSPLARLWTGALFACKPNRERRALGRIRRHAPAAGRFLDIGAGDGRLAAAAQGAGYAVTCIELSPAMAAQAARRVGREHVLVGRLSDFALERFDVVVAISVLEHDPEPRQMLNQVREILRPDGVLILKVPNLGSYLRRIRGRRWSGFRWPEHVQYFTPATLRSMVERARLEVTWIEADPLSDNVWLATCHPRATPLA
jgi:SAM-dependent methyltransferase